MKQVAAIIGGGVIGGGWAARFLLNGWDVCVFDPDPEAERKISEVLPMHGGPCQVCMRHPCQLKGA